MDSTGSQSVIATAAAIQATAAVANVLVVLFLVKITKRYVDETAEIAAATREATESSRLSAEAMERSVQLAIRPTLHIPPALNFDVLSRKRLTGNGSAHDVVPSNLSLRIENHGPGRAYAVSPTVMINDTEYRTAGPIRPETSLGPTEDITIAATAEDQDLIDMLDHPKLDGTVSISCRDSAGATWHTEWPFMISRNDATSAIVYAPTTKRIESWQKSVTKEGP